MVFAIYEALGVEASPLETIRPDAYNRIGKVLPLVADAKEHRETHR